MLKRLLTPAPRFILTIGNEGGRLVLLEGGRLKTEWRADSIDEMATLAAPLAAAPRTPLVVLADILEQSFRRETTPKLNPMDRLKVLRRRLERAFPGAPARAALKLRAEADDRTKENYLFAAIPRAEDWDRWSEFLVTLDNPILGLGLLPVEAIGLVAKLAAAVAPADATANPWTVLISRQQTGGFRQIVVNRGELVLTRLTPSLPREATFDEVGAEIHQELRATLGYMTRLGYRADAGLDIIVLAPEALRPQLEDSALSGAELHVIPLADAARHLELDSLESAERVDATLMFCAWAGRRRRLSLQLLPQDLRARMLEGLGLRWATAGMAASAVALVSYSALSAASGWQTEQEVAWLGAWEGSARQRLGRAEDQVTELSSQAEAMRKVLHAHDQLQADRLDPFAALQQLRTAMTPEDRLLRFEWQIRKAAALGPRRAPAPNQPTEATLDLTLDLEHASDRHTAVQTTEHFAARLTEVFPEREISIVRQAVDILPHQEFVGGDGPASVATSRAEGMTAELKIAGRDAGR